MSFATTFISGAGYNLLLALIAFVLFHVAVRFINNRNGYTLDKLIQDNHFQAVS